MAEPKLSIVFTDVDGTLVDDEHHPMLQSAPTIRRVLDQGIRLCMVSARSPEGLYPIQRQLGFSGPLVCFSGAYVLDEDGTELLSHTIPLEDAVAIKGWLASELPDVCVGTYGFHTWVTDDRSDPRVAREEYYVQAASTECSDLRVAFDERGIHKFLLMGEPEAISAAEQVVGERYPGLNVVRSNSTLCEIMSKEARKSDAVRFVCAHFGIDPAEAVAFGDGPNDLDMLMAVERSYAMSNGEEAVKAAAAHVTSWSNVECGVTRTLDELLSGA